MQKITIIAATLLIAISTSTQAGNKNQNDRERPKRPCFSTFDTDSNGKITLEEFSSHELPHGKHETIFSHIDANSDGVITTTEFNNHQPPKRKKSKRKGHD